MAITVRPVPAPRRRGPAGRVPTARRSALHELPVLTRLPLLALTGLGVLAVGWPATAAALAVPIALVGVVIGVPHGAVDHLVPWWWSAGSAPPLRRVLTFAVGYAGIAAAALAALLFAPTPTLTAFLVLSAVHFGRGEVVAWAERAGRPVPAPMQDLLPSAAAGAAVVGLLLWTTPETVDPLLRRLSPALADGVLTLRPAGLVAVAVLVLLALARLLAERRPVEAGELLLIAGVFALAPPLAAFGVYFGLWHAVRHTGRLLDLAREAVVGTRRVGTWGEAGCRLARDGWLPTGAALAAIYALWALRDVAGFEAQVSILLALTFPHAAVVWVLDRRSVRAG